MLGSITRSFDDIYTRLGSRPFVSEAKLDGQRGQIHVWVGDKRPPGVADNAGKWFTDDETGKKIWVRMFSRHLEDMSEKYPDIGGTILVSRRRLLGVALTLSRADIGSTSILQGIVQRAEATETPLRNFVIDCEVVAIDPVSGAFKTFQELSCTSRAIERAPLVFADEDVHRSVEEGRRARRYQGSGRHLLLRPHVPER
jgi:DNA ligase-1